MRVALWCAHLPSLWAPGAQAKAGGAETQYDLLARSLASEGIDVVVVGRPVPGVQPPHGVRIVTVDLRPGRLPELARMAAAVWRAARTADAGLHVFKAAGASLGVLALRCRLRAERLVYHWASDADLDGRRMSGGWPERQLFVHGRRSAHAQVCQTTRQHAALPARERRRAEVVPNILEAARWRAADSPGDRVLWVGAIKEKAKRPHLFLNLAAALPHLRFRMVGDLRGTAAFQAHVHERLASLPNVEFAGAVPQEAMPQQYQSARCLVNTSDVEGFPNTFLEAWASGVPVVSLAVDPEGLLARGAGVCLDGDVARLRGAVEAMFDESTWRRHHEAAMQTAARFGPERMVEFIRRQVTEANGRGG